MCSLLWCLQTASIRCVHQPMLLRDRNSSIPPSAFGLSAWTSPRSRFPWSTMPCWTTLLNGLQPLASRRPGCFAAHTPTRFAAISQTADG